MKVHAIVIDKSGEQIINHIWVGEGGPANTMYDGNWALYRPTSLTSQELYDLFVEGRYRTIVDIPIEELLTHENVVVRDWAIKRVESV